MSAGVTTRGRSCGRLVALGLLCASVSGCSVLSPLPLWELTKGAGHAASHFLGAPRASDTLLHVLPTPDALCIVHNPHVGWPEVLVALQAELHAQGLGSRVFDSAAAGAACRVWLHYSATVELDIPPFEAQHRPVLTAATLSLVSADGRALARSSYRASGVFVSGRWHGTRAKLAPVVAALLGREAS